MLTQQCLRQMVFKRSDQINEVDDEDEFNEEAETRLLTYQNFLHYCFTLNCIDN